jgi:hypothetical protein
MSDVFKTTLDPNGAFEGVPSKGLYASLGLIPAFCHAVALSSPVSVREAFDMLMDEYGYGSGDGTKWKATIRADGTLVSDYDEDPDLPPWALYNLTEDIKVYQYQSGIISVTDGNDTLITRMD